MFGRFRIRTDLALEARESFEEDDVKIRGVRIEEEDDEELEIHTTRVVIETENGAKTMGKPVGKYGVQVQNLLKKAATLDIQMICPLHGPILKENLGYYIGKYLTWSSYEPEEKGVVIACASIHGNTMIAAKKLAEILKAKGEKNVVLYDLARDDMPSAIADAYRYDRLVVAAASYDGGIFPCMETFLRKLKAKNFQKRTVGYIQNGTWAPCTAKQMQAIMGELKNITNAEPVVTIKSAMKEADIAQLEALADALMA